MSASNETPMLHTPLISRSSKHPERYVQVVRSYLLLTFLQRANSSPWHFLTQRQKSPMQRFLIPLLQNTSNSLCPLHQNSLAPIARPSASLASRQRPSPTYGRCLHRRRDRHLSFSPHCIPSDLTLGVDGVDVVIGISSFLREFSHGIAPKPSSHSSSPRASKSAQTSLTFSQYTKP